MPISDANRSRFQMIGTDQLALALAAGTICKLVVGEAMKVEAIEWIKEKDAERDPAKHIGASRFKAMLRWTVVAAIASVVAATTGIIVVIIGIITSMR